MAATTKTLTPTNQVISIPAFTDKPDNRLQTDSTSKLADAVNALSGQIGNSNIKQDQVSDLNDAVIQDGFKFFTYLNTASNKPGTGGGAGICFANGGYAVQIVFANRGADDNFTYLRNAWGLGTSSVSWGTWKLISAS